MGDQFGKFIHEYSKRYVDTYLIVDGDKVITQTPFYLRSRANSRGNWRLQAVRNKEERNLGNMLASQCVRTGCERLSWLAGGLGTSYAVELVRMSTSSLDSDNLVSAFKSIRDGIADALATTDGPKGGLQWEYGQERRREFGVRIALKKLNGILQDSTT